MRGAAGLSLYHCEGTRSLRTLWLLLELGLPFELIEIPFDLPSLKHPGYRAIHPLGRVPGITDGGLALFESGAIAEYLCERVPDTPLGRPPGHPDRPLWLQWIHFAETMAAPLSSLVQQRLFIAPKEGSPAVRQIEERRLHKAIALIDAELADRDHLLESSFSAADVAIAATIHLAAPHANPSQWPAVATYMTRIAARPAFGAATGRCALPAHVTRRAFPGGAV